MAGMYISALPGEKIARLYKLRSMLSEIMTLLRVRAVTVYELARELEGDYSQLGFVRQLCGTLERGADFYPVWEGAVLSDKSLSGGERELLLSAGGVLGSCDVCGQLAALEVCIARLDMLIGAAAEDKRRKTPLYRGLGFLAGLFASVLLM